MIPTHWIAHQRPDGEIVGWIDLDTAAPAILPIDRLGRRLAEVETWPEAEDAIEAVGLSVLLGRFQLTLPDASGVVPVAVRIVQVFDDRIVLTTALTDAVGEPADTHVVPFPSPDYLVAED